MDVQSRPLFDRYPVLRARHPLARLAELPTPVRRLEALGRGGELWLKDDGASSRWYGGNKVRKLELLLAAAKARGARTVVTFGFAGSNHATATAVHARRIGLESVSMLLPQHNAEYLRKNLLVSAASGASIVERSSRSGLAAACIAAIARTTLHDGRPPYVIAPGGSSPLGTLGFVNAAYELALQVEAGLLPLPRRIYAAAGSLGTVVGLAIGLAALGLPTKVVGVRVVEREYVNPVRVASLWKATVGLIRAAERGFPDVGAPGDRIELRDEHFGRGYAMPTEDSRSAGELALEHEALDLDPTYTAKAMACLLADMRSGRASGPTLFWNTCNGADLAPVASRVLPRELPERMQRYFDHA